VVGNVQKPKHSDLRHICPSMVSGVGQFYGRNVND
jgi:hypothetical protein